MDGRRNYPQDPDSESRWHPQDRGYDERDRGYGEDRGYQPRRADDRDYDDGFRLPEQPRRGYGGGGYDPYADDPSSGAFPPLGPRPTASPASGVPSSGVPSSGGSAAGMPGLAAPPGPPLTVPQPPGPPLTMPPGPPGAPGPHDPLTATGELSGESAGRAHRAEPFDRTALHRPVPAEAPGSVYRSKRPGLAVLLGVLTVLFELPVLRLFATASTADRIDGAGTVASIFMILGLPMFAMGLYGLVTGAAAAAPGPRAWLRTPLAYLPVGLLLFLAAALAG